MVTLYLENSDYQKKKAAKTPLMQKTSAHTPKARVSQPSNTSIPDSDPKSNSFDKNSSKNAEPHPPQAVTLPQQGRQGGRSALAHDKKANAIDVKSLKAKIVETGIDPKGIVELAASISSKIGKQKGRAVLLCLL